MNLRLIVSALLLFAAGARSQAQVVDTTFYNAGWQETERANHSFYRTIRKTTDGKFLATDYFRTGQVQMTGSFKSLSPEVKDGEFIWYHSNGRKQTATNFQDNVVISTKSWNEDGVEIIKPEVLDRAFSSAVDTVRYADLLIALKGFLFQKNNGSLNNSFVHPDYLKSDAEPFQHIQNIEEELPDGSYLFKARVLSILPAEKDSWLIKLVWLGTMKDSDLAYFDRIAGLIARKTNGKYYFYNMEQYATRNWEKKQVGSIKYIYPNRLDIQKAKEMNRFCKSLAKRFDTPLVNVTYYKCEDPVQLFRVLGFDYIGNMAISSTGGLAKYWNNTIYAGNNSEAYEHEFVHVYSRTAFPNCTKLVDEGYATYLGGSGGLSLDELSLKAKAHLLASPGVNLSEAAVNFHEGIPEVTPYAYIFGALVCRDIESKLGFPGIKRLYEMTNDDEYFNILEELVQVNKTGYDAYIRKLLNM